MFLSLRIAILMLDVWLCVFFKSAWGIIVIRILKILCRLNKSNSLWEQGRVFKHPCANLFMHSYNNPLLMSMALQSPVHNCVWFRYFCVSFCAADFLPVTIFFKVFAKFTRSCLPMIIFNFSDMFPQHLINSSMVCYFKNNSNSTYQHMAMRI